MDCRRPGFPVHHQLPEPTQIHVHWGSDAIQPSHPLPSPLLLPSIFPSIRVFSNESVLLIRWPMDWSFIYNISPSNEYSGLISFRLDWLDLLAGQGTLQSLLQHHSSKASILRHSAFFVVQLSQPYMTTGKIIALTRQTFVGKVMIPIWCQTQMKTNQPILSFKCFWRVSFHFIHSLSTFYMPWPLVLTVPVLGGYFYLFCRWGNWGSGRLTDLLMDTQQWKSHDSNPAVSLFKVYNLRTQLYLSSKSMISVLHQFYFHIVVNSVINSDYFR